MVEAPAPSVSLWLAAAGAVVGTALADWVLRRLARRVPVALGRRRGTPPGAALPWRRTVEAAAMVARGVLWLVLAAWLSERVPALMMKRDDVARAVRWSLTAPMLELKDRSYSLADMLELVLALVVLWAGVGALVRIVQAQLLGGVERGARESLALLVRYALTFLGALVVLQAWGIDVTSLALLASVLGVGIGFGLQNIANNFVSGVLIGLERPIRPGDFVQVGELMGTVERVGARSTEIRTLDRVTILVPNSRLLEHEVVNWSHGDPVSRLHVPVGVAYGTSLRRARQVLLEVARGHPDVLADPRPTVELRAFGASALDLELLVWTRDPRSQSRLKSDLNYRIARSFARHRIQIPFEERDVHLHAPALERVVSAWGQREFGPDVAHAPTPHPDDGVDDDLDLDGDPRAWSDVRIAALVDRMRGPEGVPILDRRHLLASYPRCFVGREAVDWLGAATGLGRDEAVGLGRLLVARGVLHHVLDEHDFEDAPYFYRFRADEAVASPPAAAGRSSA